MKVKTAAKYADVSERTFRKWIKKGLRNVLIHGTVLVKPEWVDTFLEEHERKDSDIDKIVDEVMKDLNS